MTGLLSSDRPLNEAYDLGLLDLDGVCYRGTELIEHADTALAAARASGMELRFVTNNASRTPETVAGQLTGLGIDATPDEIVTSAQAAAGLLADELPAGAPVLVIGGPGLHEAVRAAGLRAVASADDRPVAVVQGFAPDLGWAQLAEAVYAIKSGSFHVATNLDATLPTERGVTLGNGSLVAAVRHATGVEPRSAGKPEPAIFTQAASRAGAQHPLVVGDRLDTDLAGARAAGMPGLHVLTGVNDARDVVLAPPRHRPAFLAVDLRDLAVPHPAPTRAATGWTCGTATARVVGGRLQLNDNGAAFDADAESWTITADAWRAVAAAAWESADARQPLQACPQLTVTSAR